MAKCLTYGKAIAKSLTPPLLWETVRFLMHRRQLGTRTFEGVYRHLNEIGGTGYQTEESLALLFQRTKEEFDRIGAFRDAAEVGLNYRRTLLPLLIAAAKEGEFSVLDFGGGMGTSYIDCLRSIDVSGLRYVVVDLKEVQERGRNIFPETYALEFWDRIPGLERVDIVYMGSSLQYIEDYRSIIRRLVGFKPRYVLVNDTPMGKAPTYATAQVNMRGRRIPCWIFEEREIVQLMSESGYRPIYRSANDHRLNFGDIEERLRVDHSINLLFVRSQLQDQCKGEGGQAEIGLDVPGRRSILA